MPRSTRWRSLATTPERVPGATRWRTPCRRFLGSNCYHREPLAHTLSSRQLQGVWLNDQPASEYRLHAYAAASVGVPVVFVSGDRTLCEEVHHWQPAVHTFATKWGEGASQQSVHPQDAVAGIASGLEQALTDEQAFSCIALPEFFELEIEYKHHETAFARSFYPGAERVTANRVQFASDDYYEILRSLMFLM